MAIDVAAKISLDGLTIRISNNGIRRTDGGTMYAFTPRLLAPSDSNALGPLDQALQYPSQFQLIIDNTDGWLNNYLPGGSSAERWENRRVDVYIDGTEGGALTSMSQVFSGVIPIGGMNINRTTVILRLKDLRDGQNVSFGGGVVDAVTFPNAPDASIGQAIPWALGEFSALTNGDALPIVLVDSAAGTFKVSSTPIVSGTATLYEYDGSTWGTVGGASWNYNSGTVTYAGYTATYEYRVGADFYDSTTTPAGPTTFHPVDVVNWILTDISGVAAGDINSTSFTTAKSAGDAFTVRRHSLSTMTVFEELNRLCFEGGYDLYMVDAEYYIKWFAPITTATTSIGEHNIIDGTFTTDIDPDRLYTNRVLVDYDFRASATQNSLIKEDTTEQSDFGRVVETNKIYYWLFNLADVQTSITRKLFFWKRLPEVARFQIAYEDTTASIYSLWLEDVVRVTFWRFSADDFWIRRINRDFLANRSFIEAINLQTIPNLGVWDDSSPTVSNPGYWANGSGGGVPVVTYWW